MTAIYMTSQCRHEGRWHLAHVAVRDRSGAPIEDDEALRVDEAALEFWGNVYKRNGLYAEGITFETFVQAPYQILDALATWRAGRYADAEQFETLLPSQARLQRKLDLQQPLGLLEDMEAALDKRPGTVNRNGTWIERLRHHAWPRHAERRVS